MKYMVGTPVEIERYRLALDQANRLCDALGNPTPRPGMVFDEGVRLPDDHPACAIMARHQTLLDDAMVLGDDGTAAVALDEAERGIVEHLGKTIGGTALPRARDLATAAQLVGDVAAKVDDRLIEAIGQDVTPDKLDARAQLSNEARLAVISVESEVGTARVKAALQRRKDAAARAELDTALGLSPTPGGKAAAAGALGARRPPR